MEINDTYASNAADLALSPAKTNCGCNKEASNNTSIPVELTKLQFSVVAPKSEHIALLTKVSEFLTTLGFPISNFESYRY